MYIMGYYPAIKINELLIHNKLDGSQGYYTAWKKATSKGYILYDSCITS